MIRAASLAAFLFAFWLLLSGHYTPWLTVAGALAAVAVAAVAAASGLADEEGHPVERIPAALRYWPWLIAQMLKSAVEVSRLILRPGRPAIRGFFTIPAPQATAIGMATYANSITFTPGTIAVEFDRPDEELLVHALGPGGEEGLRAGGMSRRVLAFEGARARDRDG